MLPRSSRRSARMMAAPGWLSGARLKGGISSDVSEDPPAARFAECLLQLAQRDLSGEVDHGPGGGGEAKVVTGADVVGTKLGDLV